MAAGRIKSIEEYNDLIKTTVNTSVKNLYTKFSGLILLF
jgi:hypothetical protein